MGNPFPSRPLVMAALHVGVGGQPAGRGGAEFSVEISVATKERSASEKFAGEWPRSGLTPHGGV